MQGSASRPTAHIMYDFIYKVQPALPWRAPRGRGTVTTAPARPAVELSLRGHNVPQVASRPKHQWPIRVSPGPASIQERAPEFRAFLAYLTRHTQGGFDPDCRCEYTCLPLPPWAQAGSPSYCGDRAGQKAWQKITGTDTGGRLHGPDLSPSRKPWPPSYSNLKHGINHSSEISNGGMQDAFLSERILCIHIDGLYMAV